MVDARMRQQWLMHGRLTIDLINSQRLKKDQVNPIGMYPYFDKPETRRATKEDELRLVEQLKGSKWLTVTIL